MKLIEPTIITDGTFTSSTVAEDDHAEWAVGTAYVTDDQVMIVATHLIYRCIVDNTGNDPADNIYDGDADPVTGYWSLVGATNKWRMFDNKSKSYTTSPDTIVIVLTPGVIFNSIGLVNVTADSIRIQVDDPIDGSLYDELVSMVDLSGISYYYDWFFEDPTNIENAVKIDLPAYSTGILTITIENGTDDVSIGEISIGKVKTVGSMAYEWSGLGIEDYSIKEVDDDTGIADITEGRFAKTVSYGILIDSNRVHYIQRLLAKYRATAIVYIGEVDTPETIVFGFMKDFSIVLQNLNTSECSLEVEELT